MFDLPALEECTIYYTKQDGSVGYLNIRGEPARSVTLYLCKVCQFIHPWPSLVLPRWPNIGDPRSTLSHRGGLFSWLKSAGEHLWEWSVRYCKNIPDEHLGAESIKRKSYQSFLYRIRLVCLLNNFVVRHGFLDYRNRQYYIDEYQTILLRDTGLQNILTRVDDQGNLDCSDIFRGLVAPPEPAPQLYAAPGPRVSRSRSPPAAVDEFTSNNSGEHVEPAAVSIPSLTTMPQVDMTKIEDIERLTVWKCNFILSVLKLLSDRSPVETSFDILDEEVFSEIVKKVCKPESLSAL